MKHAGEIVGEEVFYRNATLQREKSLQILSQTCKCLNIKLTESIATKTIALQMQYSFICKQMGECFILKINVVMYFFTLSKFIPFFKYI